MVAVEFALRRGVASDTVPLTDLYLRSRSTAMPWLATVHDRAETLSWMMQRVLSEQQVIVAQERERLLGFAALDGDWLVQLYVDSDVQGGGVGQALFSAVKASRPEGFSLHTFTRNTRARLFYEAHGRVMTEQSDGSRNEENEPDCTYRFEPEVPPNGSPPSPLF